MANKNTNIAAEIQLATVTANIAAMSNDISDIKKDLRDLKGQYVTLDQFIPIRNLVYGFVALILIAVIGAIISFFVLQAPTRVSLVNSTPAQTQTIK